MPQPVSHGTAAGNCTKDALGLATLYDSKPRVLVIGDSLVQQWWLALVCHLDGTAKQPKLQSISAKAECF